ncbi:MAG: tRNA pseudouridine(55) synthase [Myxococcales bacterium]
MALLEPGIHLLHKPAGSTSFSMVQPFLDEARGRRPRLAVCHGGALDPFAEGLLPILVGRVTRAFELLHPIPKEYEAEVTWGAETDNGDPLGTVVARGDASALDPRGLDAALESFLGWREQVPPPTSNKRIGGERAYARAHRGEHFELPPVRVYLHEARWTWHDLPRASGLRLVVRGGYYVRSLARDLGRALGSRAHLSRLTRRSIGPWRDPGPGARDLVQVPRLFPWYPSREIDAGDARVLRNGPIPRGALRRPEWPLPAGFPDPRASVRALLDGELVAVLRDEDGMLWRQIDLRG